MRMNCWVALSYASEARTSGGDDATGVLTGAGQVLAGGVGDGFDDGLADVAADGLAAGLGEGLGVGLADALGLDPHAIEPRRTSTAREASRLAIGGDYGL